MEMQVLYEKYKKLALESLSTGDKILAESYFQHADHFANVATAVRTECFKFR